MATLKEKARKGEYIISEAEHHRSRDAESIEAGVAVYVAGTVLGKVTVGGAFKIYDAAAVDGSSTVAGILFEGATGTQKRTVHKRAMQVDAKSLTWFDGATPAQIATGIAELEALGIVVR